MDREIKPWAYWGALTALTFDYGSKVFFSSDRIQTANLIYTLMRKKTLKMQGPIIVKKPKVEDREKMQLQTIPTLLGICLKLADRLLRDFETVRKVFNASAVELFTVKGVGKVTAYKIAKFLDAPYRSSLERPQQLRFDS